MNLPQPDSGIPHLADVIPSVLAAMGVTSFEARIELPADISGACVLLIDGLGAELLDTYAADAPVLAEMRGQTLQVGFPSTTVAGQSRTITVTLPDGTEAAAFCPRCSPQKRPQPVDQKLANIEER